MDRRVPRRSQGAWRIAKQKRGGGWRYEPQQPGDTSVVGWQVIALTSARQAGLHVSSDSLGQTNKFLNSVQANKTGSTYGYTPGAGVSPTMSAEGLLCRIYCGWKHGNEGLNQGTAYLLQFMPTRQRDFYYWYYATQVLHHYGDDPWEQWNPAIRELLISLQAQQGHEAGSWAPQGGHDGQGGRVYSTSLALLTLEVYYRHKRVY